MSALKTATDGRFRNTRTVETGRSAGGLKTVAGAGVTMPYTAPTGTAHRLSAAERVALLDPPDGDVEVVVDTDAYNEIDDQFALAYALCSASLDVRAVYAAPFDNARSDGPADGMERSYDEVRRLLDLLDHPDPDGLTHRGATAFTTETGGPVESEATADLVRRARSRDDGDPLYVLAIGAPTNVASALERAPEIVEQVVVVWLGGQPLAWHSAEEFNLRQDPRASRVLLDSGVPLVLVPCKNVAEHLRTSVPELEHHLGEGGALSRFLLDRFTDYGPSGTGRTVWSKEVWDLAPVAYLLEDEWVPTHLAHSPHLSPDLRYGHDTSRHLIRVAMDARRDRVFGDLFEALEGR
jgi:inosine-uridine nucleoside N-ribohydrolase